jgi:tRNA pseudouridine38-40 synthase
MSDLPPRRNIKLVIAYNGAAYHGWQRQADGIDTIQQRIEDGATRILAHPVIVFGAGRTDAGVHACGQVANLYTTNPAVPLKNLRRALTARLPGDIAILSAVEVPEAFHASRSAIGKTYRYRLYLGPNPPVMLHRQVCRVHGPLELEAMHAAADRLVGEHDFRGFATSAEVREDTVRTITSCQVAAVGPEVHVTCQGGGFLYNMVRNIVGTLVEIGRGRWGPDRIEKILASRDRRDGGPCAVPDGLYLMCVHYRPEDLRGPLHS